jgi:hypothetical protein
MLTIFSSKEDVNVDRAVVLAAEESFEKDSLHPRGAFSRRRDWASVAGFS